MHYDFPIIRHLNDVLPAIEGTDEFSVNEKDGYTIVNYNVQKEHTFDINHEHAAMRRECRGLKFYPNGEIAARTLHKFFNVNEKPETQSHLIDLSKPHVVMEKLDGSMIHPMMVNGYIRWMTKMGITDVAMQAEEFIAKNTNYKDFAAWCIENGITPTFEWTSPRNRIVVPYKNDQLTLLAVRENLTGHYLNIK